MNCAYCPWLILAVGLSVLPVLEGSMSLAQQVIAHRGASYDAPENTLAAFRLAWQQGADGIEGDFYLTADGEIVCLHDSDTGRTGDRKLSVGQSTLAELRKVDVGGMARARNFAASGFRRWPRSSRSFRPANRFSSRSSAARRSCRP